MLSVLHDSSLSENKKQCIVEYSIIPLLAATGNNSKIDLNVAIPDAFLLPYLREFLPSLQTRNGNPSIPYLCSLLKLNSLLAKFAADRVRAEHGPIVKFATDLYESSNDLIQAWAVYFLCQYTNTVQFSEVHASRLFVMILNMYKNRNQDLVLKSSRLLIPSLNQIGKEYKEKIFLQVRQRLCTSEQYKDQQIHILNLIVQNLKFFYVTHKSVSQIILNRVRFLSVNSRNAYNNRKLYIDILCVVVSFLLRQKREDATMGRHRTPFSSSRSQNERNQLLPPRRIIQSRGLHHSPPLHDVRRANALPARIRIDSHHFLDQQRNPHRSKPHVPAVLAAPAIAFVLHRRA